MGAPAAATLRQYQLERNSSRKVISDGEQLQQQQKEISAREQKQQQKSRNDILSGEQKLYWKGGYIS